MNNTAKVAQVLSFIDPNKSITEPINTHKNVVTLGEKSINHYKMYLSLCRYNLNYMYTKVHITITLYVVSKIYLSHDYVILMNNTHTKQKKN